MVEDRPDDDRTDFGVIILDSEKVDDEVEGSIIKIAFVKNLIKICIHVPSLGFSIGTGE